VIPLYGLFEKTVLRDPLCQLLPLLVCGVCTALVLASQWFVGLLSDRNQSSQQHQSISKGARR
jgi:hypothetical protein